MARHDPDVKQESWWSDLLEWADAHPRVAWWLVLIAHLNLLLNVVGAFNLFS